MPDFDILPVAVGAAVTCAIVLSLRLSGMSKDAAAAPIILVAIAVFYPVFAAENGTVGQVLVHTGVAMVFAGVAVMGYRLGPSLVAVGLIAHGLFDLAMACVETNLAPAFWPAFCLTVDLLLGAWLLLYTRNAISDV